ncbi:MAG: Ig-like domain-containing protein [Fimbriimonadaceae bacterium]
MSNDTITKLSSTLDLRRGKTRSLMVVCASLALITAATAQPFRYGWRNILVGTGANSDTANAQIVDKSGNLYVLYTTVVGVQQNCILRKFTPLGAVTWSTEFEVAPGASRPDTGCGLALDSTGSPYASVGAPINSAATQACLVKFSPTTGAVVFRKVFNSGANAFFPRRIAIDSANNIIQAGGYGSNAREKFGILKWNSAGTLLWSNIYRPTTTTADTEAFGLTVSSTNDIFAGGYTNTSAHGQDGLIVKFRGTDGVAQWSSIVFGTALGRDIVRAITADSAGNAYAVGDTYVSSTNLFAFCRKLNGTTGATIWQNTINSPSNNASTAIGVGLDPSGNVLVGGDFWGTNPRPDLFVQKINATTGSQMFMTLINGLTDTVDIASGFAVDRFGNSYVSGGSTPFTGATRLTDFLVARVSNSGVINWQYRYAQGFSSTLHDTPGGLAMDNLTGQVYVTGDQVPNINADGKLLTMYQAPIAAANTYTMTKNTTLDSGTPGVMANDVWRLNCTTSIVTPPSNGTFSLATNGRFTYTPPTNFVGTVTFKYRLTRTGLTTSDATVTIRVN